MADAATPTTPEPAAPDTGNAAPDPAEEAAKWKAMARKWEGTAKDNSAAAQKLAAIEEASKSEQQKAADKMADYERRTQEAELKALRYEVGVEKGIPTKLLRYLAGATKDDIEANAEQLMADFGTGAAAEPASGRPREALRPGAVPTASPDGNQAINDRIRQAARR
jgi:hypothetical protein